MSEADPIKERCSHLKHKPPTNLHFDGEYTHVCPGCGHRMVLKWRPERFPGLIPDIEELQLKLAGAQAEVVLLENAFSNFKKLISKE